MLAEGRLIMLRHSLPRRRDADDLTGWLKYEPGVASGRLPGRTERSTVLGLVALLRMVAWDSLKPLIMLDALVSAATRCTVIKL